MPGALIAGLIAGIAVGWNASQAWGAHGEVKSSKAKIPRYRKARLRSGVMTAVTVLLVVAVLANLGHR
jgi:hypothetical protein